MTKQKELVTEILDRNRENDKMIMNEILATGWPERILKQELGHANSVFLEIDPALFYIISNLLGYRVIHGIELPEVKSAMVDWLVRSSLALDDSCPKAAAHTRTFAKELLSHIFLETFDVSQKEFIEQMEKLSFNNGKEADKCDEF